MIVEQQYIYFIIPQVTNKFYSNISNMYKIQLCDLIYNIQTKRIIKSRYIIDTSRNYEFNIIEKYFYTNNQTNFKFKLFNTKDEQQASIDQYDKMYINSTGQLFEAYTTHCTDRDDFIILDSPKKKWRIEYYEQ